MAQCAHIEIEASRCEDCGACVHELILNGVCYYCGEEKPNVTVKPAEPALIPAQRLSRPKDDLG